MIGLIKVFYSILLLNLTTFVGIQSTIIHCLKCFIHFNILVSDYVCNIVVRWRKSRMPFYKLNHHFGKKRGPRLYNLAIYFLLCRKKILVMTNKPPSYEQKYILLSKYVYVNVVERKII